MANVESTAKWVTILVTVAGFAWGVSSSLQSQAIAARRPFLDLQLKLYQEATKTTSILASSADPNGLRSARARFWQLYWGELAMVENGGLHTENGGVEGAMARFGRQLLKDPQDQAALQELSLELAHVCRDSLAESWGVRDWRSPDYGQGRRD